MKTQHQISSYLNTLTAEIELIERRTDAFQDEVQKRMANMPHTGVWTNVPEEPVIESSTVLALAEPVPLYTYLAMLYSAQMTIKWVLDEPA